MRRRFAILLGVMGGGLAAAQSPATLPVSALGESTRVTVSIDNLPAGEAFAALQEASGIEFAPAPNALFDRIGQPPLDLTATDMPWLEAFARLTEQAGVRAQMQNDAWLLVQGYDRNLSGRRAVVGPLLFSLHSVGLDTEIEFGQPNRTSRSCSLSGLILAEPRLPPMTIVGVSKASATDDQGRALNVRLPALRPAAEINRRDFNLQLDIPDEHVRQIRDLDVTVRLIQFHETAELHIDDVLTEGASGKVGDAVFTVRKVDMPQTTQAIITIDISPGAMQRELLAMLDRLQQPLDPRWSDARRSNVIRVSNLSITDSGVELQLTVRSIRRPREEAEKSKAELYWRIPIACRVIEAPVSFKEIPLP